MRKRNRRLLSVALCSAMSLSPALTLLTAAPVIAAEEAEQVTAKRVDEINYEKTYALVFKDEKQNTIRLANGNDKNDGKYNGLSVDSVSAAFAADETISVSNANLFKFEQGENGKVALKALATNKYVSVNSSNRNVTLNDTPVWLDLDTGDHFVSGKTVLLHAGNYYLNYSHSRQMVNSYDFNGDNVSSGMDVHGNHMALFEVQETSEPAPVASKASRVSALEEGKAYILAGGDNKKNEYKASGSVLNTSGSIAYLESSADAAGFPDELSYETEQLICVLPDGNGKAALYHTGLKKYIGLDVTKGTTDNERRSVLVSDDPIMMDMETAIAPYGGTAFYFHSGNYYLNYSASRHGFCGYDYTKDGVDAGTDLYGNAVALYAVDYADSPKLPTETENPIISYDGVISTILLTSDYQTWSEVPSYSTETDVPEVLTSVIDGIGQQMKKAGAVTVDAALLAGDYSAFNGQYNYDADAEIGVTSLKNRLSNLWEGLDTFYAVQGNHDSDTYAFNEGPSVQDNYLVYSVNTRKNYAEMGSFPWNQGGNSWTKGAVETLASKMDAWMNELEEKGDTRPIFVVMHVPLHYSGRTSTMYSGDNIYSKILFDVINEHAKNLNVTVLYGHNHSNGWDSYLGGDAVFRKPGDVMLIPDYTAKSGSGTNSYTEETINFTYLNAGYVGYYKDPQSNGTNAAGDLTSTLVQIHKDKVVYYRFDANGLHNLSDQGKQNDSTSYNDTSLIPAKYYAPVVASGTEIMLKEAAEPSLTLEGKTVSVGETATLEAAATRMPDAVYTWSVDKEDLAEITSDGKTAQIKAKKAGTLHVTLTAVSGDKELTANADVIINALPGEASVSINTLPDMLFKSDVVEVSAQIGGMSEIDSVTWSIDDPAVATVTGKADGKADLNLLDKGEGILTVTVTGKDGAGEDVTKSASVSFEVSDALRYVRTDRIEAGQSYLLLGWSDQIGETLPGTGKAAVSSQLSTSSTKHLLPVNISEASVNKTDDSFQGDYQDLLWTVTEKDGKYAFQSVKTKKYLNLSNSDRSVSMSDTPVYLTVQNAAAAFSGASGQAIAISNGSYYLNYSRSRGGFLGYSSSSEDHTAERNQYLLYKASGEEAPVEDAVMTGIVFNSNGVEVTFDKEPSEKQKDDLTVQVAMNDEGYKPVEIISRKIDGNNVILSFPVRSLSERESASASVILDGEAKTADFSGQKYALDFEALENALDQYTDTDLDDYLDDEAKTACEKAYADAVTARAQAKTQDAVNKAAQDLSAAINGLNEKPAPVEINTDALKAAVEAAEEKDLDLYEDNDQKTAFAAALEQARAVLENPESQEAVNAAAQTLNAAAENLVEIQPEVIDVEALKEAAAAADRLVKEDYEDDDHMTAFEAALAQARSVLMNPESQEAVDQALTALENAQKNLTKKNDVPELNLDALNEAIKKAEDVNLEDYEDDQDKEDFVKALAFARNIAANSLGQDEIDQAAADLNKAAAALNKKQEPSETVNTEELAKAVEAESKKDPKDYEDGDEKDAWNKALSDAESILESAPSQKAVDDALEALLNASKALKPVNASAEKPGDEKPSGSQGDNQSGTDDKKDDSKTDQKPGASSQTIPSGTKKPATGISAAGAMMASVSALTGALFASIRRKRSKK